MQTKESVERQYELLKELYGIQSSGWSMLHTYTSTPHILDMYLNKIIY